MSTRTFAVTFVAIAGTVLAQAPAGSEKIPQKTFESPQAATQALLDAASKNDTASLRAVLGSSAKGILTSGDPKQDAAERQEFAKIANEKHHLEQSSMNSRVMVLLIGDQEWPFPVPLLHDGDRWRFDPQRGAVEVRARQLGANELEAIRPAPRLSACSNPTQPRSVPRQARRNTRKPSPVRRFQKNSRKRPDRIPIVLITATTSAC